MGPRGGQTSYRDQQSHRSNFRTNNQDQQEIDNWDPTSTQVTAENKNDETWGDCGDWDNEEYTGSLSDTKVFTPSGATSSGQDLAAPPGLEQQILNPPSQNDVPQYSTTVASSTATAAALNNGQYGEMHSATTAAAQLRQALEMPLGQSASLSVEQSQYFNTLGSQNSTAYSSTVQYPYNDQVGNQQAPRQQQQQQRPRARVPPPSKIPSSAVEMPGDGLNVYLGVQFGELDFGTGTEESYESDKYASGMEQSTNDDYTPNKSSGVSKGSQSSGLGGLPSQLIQNSDSISSSGQSDLTSGYAQRNPNVNNSMGTAGTQSGLDQLTKPADIYNHATGTTTGGNAYQNLSYSGTQKGGGYQTGYSTSAYNSTQSSNNYQQPSNNYGGYNQNSYQGAQSGTGQQQTQTTGSSVSSTANQPVNNSSG